MAVTVIVEFPPLHKIGVDEDEATNCEGSLIVTEAEAEQPFASVTVYDCVPAFAVNVPVPTYGPVPPEAATVTTEVPPKHEIVVALAVAFNTVGSVTTTDTDAVHPFASVTV